MRYTTPLVGLVVAGALTLSACGGDDDSSSAADTTAAAAATVAADTTAAGGSTGAADTTAADATGGSTPTTMVVVDANTATAAEITAALEANGVTNADKWTDEIMEYRPYDTGDPTLAHLRDELAKYNPGSATLEAIIATLSV